MKIDQISEIGIDIEERLYIKPSIARFDLIYRTATEVLPLSVELSIAPPRILENL
ncbi:hypothetical protein FHT21_001797 [Pedobacter sp. SG908]|nr:hypothetical protein [Pedobacter sp. SG908]NMN36770.1 hypothetical protein [Pedobacter sp. SG918]